MGTRSAVVLLLLLAAPEAARAQTTNWTAEGSVGWAGFVDDATQHYSLFGGSMRRAITPRLSIGPELVVMSSSKYTRDRNVLLTGNMVYDVAPAARVSPFVVAGGGIFWARDQVANGPFWSSDPAFTAGAGVRAALADTLFAAAEYRLGWELHHRISGSLGVRW